MTPAPSNNQYVCLSENKYNHYSEASERQNRFVIIYDLKFPYDWRFAWRVYAPMICLCIVELRGFLGYGTLDFQLDACN